MQKGDFVINPIRPELGIGQVVQVGEDYIRVYFSDGDDYREYQTSANALVKIPAEDRDRNAPPKQPVDPHQPHVQVSLSLQSRVERDSANALLARDLADKELKEFRPYRHNDTIVGDGSQKAREREVANERYRAALKAVSGTPFHAMVEVEVETQRDDRPECKKQLLYANKHISTNTPLRYDGNRVNVQSWTHPCVQLGLSRDLREEIDLQERGYTLRKIKPLARAKYFQVLPSLSGLYEPGGRFGEEERDKTSSGLKAVKLEMTRDQVDAFLSKMKGMMLVSGAPGSGKTTVAMQRIRFLIDQQDLRTRGVDSVEYSTGLTKIFLANPNLIVHSKEMLENDLQIPASVVEHVDEFLAKYLNELWVYKHNATVRKKHLFPLEERGRQAFFGLCGAGELQDCWRSYEAQIAERFGLAHDAAWKNLLKGNESVSAADRLAVSLERLATVQAGRHPFGSSFSLDAVYRYTGKKYEEVRELVRGQGILEKFDTEFQKWIFWVYDPFDALVSYFNETMHAGKVRVKKGTAGRIDGSVIQKNIREEWRNRSYGKEMIPWLAFLLRFALPETTDQRSRFREMPNPLAIAGMTNDARWTHVMIDEAQDLCVPQAALLASFVHPDGAFTVSADFHQIVSPVWGMETPDAFKIGTSLRDKGVFQSYPFAKNMRQSKQIGLLLQSFYQSVFGEMAPFDINTEVESGKPLLFVGNAGGFVPRIVQRWNVLRRNSAIQSIALLQVNEDETALIRIREGLEALGVDLAPLWESVATPGQLITTSVERIKGLEFDACFVLGLDDSENRNLNFAKNRAYVALSRPAKHLAMFCAEIPRSLQRIRRELIETIHI